MQNFQSFLRIFPPLLLSACGLSFDGADLPLDSVSEGLGYINGRSLNGRSLNGRSLNGTTLTAFEVVSIALASGQKNGQAISQVALVGTDFVGTAQGGAMTGSDFVGTTWIGTTTSNHPIALRIDHRSALSGNNADTSVYAVSIESPTGWTPLCGGDAEVLAVPIPGTFDHSAGTPTGGSFTRSHDVFSFACRGATIAKCVELGYKPWIMASSGPVLEPYLIACTRLLRADYCGDGTPNTADGTLLSLYDNLAIQRDTESWPVEAEWTPRGARCTNPATIDRYKSAGLPRPYCLPWLQLSSCGLRGFPLKTLLIDRFSVTANGATNFRGWQGLRTLP